MGVDTRLSNGQDLAKIRVLYRQSDTLVLWGIPYEMRPGQAPRHLWEARTRWKPLPPGWHGGAKQIDLSDWIEWTKIGTSRRRGGGS